MKKICPQCKGEFSVKPSAASRRVFCSKKCCFAQTPAERFELYVDRKSSGVGCWLWTGSTSGHGRARFSLGDKMVNASRFAWQQSRGAIPEGLGVLHECDNPLCVNPSHLFLGTQKSNAEDMVRKGRHPFGERCGKATLTWDMVREIRERHIPRKRGHGAPTLAKEFGVTGQTILEIVRGNIWKEENLKFT